MSDPEQSRAPAQPNPTAIRRVRVCWAEGAGFQVHALRDLSARGMFVLTSAAPAVGREVQFELAASGAQRGAQVVAGHARIVWNAPGQGVALEFLDVSLNAEQLAAWAQGRAPSRRLTRRAASRKLVQHAGSIGVDFGTSQLRVAVLVSGQARMLEFFDARPSLASTCIVNDGGAVVAGREAAEQRVLAPERALHGIKRLIGRACNSQVRARLAPHYGFALATGSDHRLGARVGDRVVSMEQAAVACFVELKRASEYRLGALVNSAVVGVPCHFNASQRHALLGAARGAGFANARLVSEPIAAALAHAAGRKLSQLVLVVDVGAGSTQVALVEIRDHELAMLTADGDATLGGVEFDEAIAARLLASFDASHAGSTSLTAQQVARLLAAAEEAKCALSFQPNHTATVPYFSGRAGSQQDLHVALGVAELEQLTHSLLDRVVALVERVIADSPIARGEIDELLLVGGMTKMPALRQRITECVGRAPNRRVLPADAVAQGLCWLGDTEASAAPLLFEALVEPIKMAAGSALIEVLPRGTAWPVKRPITLHGESGRPLRVHLFAGSSSLASECAYLGSLTLDAAGRGGSASVYHLELALDDDGVLQASATTGDGGQPVACPLDYRRSFEAVLADAGLA